MDSPWPAVPEFLAAGPNGIGENVIKLLQSCAFTALACIACSAGAEPVAIEIPGVANTLQSSNHRLFISSDSAFFELRLHAGTWKRTPLSVQFNDRQLRTCSFRGIAERAGTIYTVCTAAEEKPVPRSFLLGLDTNAPMPTLREVGELHELVRASGLAVDQRGDIFLADSGEPDLPGKIRKITLAGAYAIAAETTFHRFAVRKPGALRHAGGRLYVSVNPLGPVGLSQLLSYEVGAKRLRRPKNIYHSLDLLDDFALVKGGIVAVHVFGASIVFLDEQGIERRRATFARPSSVGLLTSERYGAGSLLVAERDSGTVYRFFNDWGLKPR